MSLLLKVEENEMKSKIYFLFDIKPPKKRKKQIEVCRLYANNGKNGRTCKSCCKIKWCLALAQAQQKSTAT